MQVSANGISLEVDDRGPPDGEPLVMIMGLGMQLVAWPEGLVDLLVERGLRVIRFDNRDIGLSQRFDHLGVPNLAMAGMRHTLGLPVASPYVVVAIGPPHAMQEVFEHTPAMQRLTLLAQSYGVGISVQTRDHLTVSAASVRDVNFARQSGPK